MVLAIANSSSSSFGTKWTTPRGVFDHVPDRQSPKLPPPGPELINDRPVFGRARCPWSRRKESKPIRLSGRKIGEDGRGDFAQVVEDLLPSLAPFRAPTISNHRQARGQIQGQRYRQPKSPDSLIATRGRWRHCSDKQNRLLSRFRKVIRALGVRGKGLNLA